MKNNRLNYFLLVILILILGILSRKIPSIPLFFGDLLYAVLIYFGFRFLLIKSKETTSFLLSLLFCFAVEIFQLCQLEWIVLIRKTVLGHYILGEGFLWSDLLCYLIGNVAALGLEKVLLPPRVN